MIRKKKNFFTKLLIFYESLKKQKMKLNTLKKYPLDGF